MTTMHLDPNNLTATELACLYAILENQGESCHIDELEEVENKLIGLLHESAEAAVIEAREFIN